MKFYLTIDDGPSKDSLQKLLVLKDRGIKAIWFCKGDQLKQYPDCADQLIRDGHILANHSYSHPHFSDISYEAAIKEIDDTDGLIDQAYERTGSKRPVKYFRFPYGEQGQWNGVMPSINPRRLQHQRRLREYLTEQGFINPLIDGVDYRVPYANKRGDADWLWSYDVREWAIGRDTSIDEVIGNLQRYLQSSKKSKDQVILIHDHLHTTEYFERLIDVFVNSGVVFTDPHTI